MTKVEQKTYNRKWHLNNKEEQNEKCRVYYIDHEEEIKARKRARYIVDREEKLKIQKKYYFDNREDILKKEKENKRKRKMEKPWTSHLKSAKERCNNPNSKDFHRYGGRGICFLITVGEIKDIYLRDNAKDMKQPSIDRIDNDGNYAFGNCRFIELAENSRLSANGRLANMAEII